MTKQRTILALAALAVGLPMSAGASDKECAKGQSEAALVTSRGTIAVCVDEDALDSEQGNSLAVEAVECPCADVVPDARKWKSLNDMRRCESTGNGLMVQAMEDTLKGKWPKHEVWTYFAGEASGQCYFRVELNEVVHQMSSHLLTTDAAAEACQTLARELYAQLAGSRKPPGVCSE